ncbi:MAG: GtrA family protein [Muribaculaceae bacterium]|nr:GtrA family protein [Muribaculaceae bacterium]
MGKIKEIRDKIAHSDSLLFSFLRSGASSQAASWVDLSLGFALFAWLGMAPWASTAIGALVGGAVNCVLCYRFTFHAQGCPWKAVIIKYLMVWLGSLILNSGGTEVCYYMIQDWDFLQTLGFRPDGYYAAARLTVSLLVGWFWNFGMQRYFVFRHSGFDIYAIRFVDSLIPHHHSTVEEA